VPPSVEIVSDMLPAIKAARLYSGLSPFMSAMHSEYRENWRIVVTFVFQSKLAILDLI
jgi:hypothetical protein